MTKLKVGDKVKGNNAFTFDPIIGIVIGHCYNLDYLKIEILEAKQANYINSIWNYPIKTLSKIETDWDE